MDSMFSPLYLRWPPKGFPAWTAWISGVHGFGKSNIAFKGFLSAAPCRGRGPGPAAKRLSPALVGAPLLQVTARRPLWGSPTHRRGGRVHGLLLCNSWGGAVTDVYLWHPPTNQKAKCGFEIRKLLRQKGSIFNPREPSRTNDPTPEPPPPATGGPGAPIGMQFAPPVLHEHPRPPHGAPHHPTHGGGKG